jgi:hypothetical protein
MVPPKQMHRLHQVQRAKSCTVVEIPAAGHMDAYDVDPATYWGSMTEFVESLS